MPPIRIGLGARPASDARRMADLLAAAARTEFARIRTRGMSGEKDAGAEPGVEPMFSGEDAREAMAEVRGYLKAFKQIADREAPEPSAQQAAALAVLRGLIGIAREVAKGPDGNPVVVDNVDLLKARYVDMFAGTALTPPSGPSPSISHSPDPYASGVNRLARLAAP